MFSYGVERNGSSNGTDGRTQWICSIRTNVDPEHSPGSAGSLFNDRGCYNRIWPALRIDTRSRTSNLPTARTATLRISGLIAGLADVATQLATHCAGRARFVCRWLGRKSCRDEGAESGSVRLGSDVRSSCVAPLAGEAAQATAPEPLVGIEWCTSELNPPSLSDISGLQII